jgi:thioredoxin 1
MALEITDANFEGTTQAGVTLVDFWAPRCGPCQMQGPIVDKIAEEYDGKASIGKLNVDDNADTAAKFGVMSIPTLILFKDGEKIEQFTGVQSEDKLKAALDAQL